MHVPAITATLHKNKGNTAPICSPFIPQQDDIRARSQRFRDLIESCRNRVPGLAHLGGGSG